ncbi:O-antigen biosynthesis glycosyltransferase WbnK [Lachnospiraceae bacterium]|nr:O-antigen biosynthesis glycosyltransferase WbnK [Lachnospiraceae bacterium]
MIVVQVCGGLGNQLFQYAFARSLQNRGNEVRLAAVFYTKYRTSREYLLDKFRIKIKRSYLTEKVISPVIDNDLPIKMRNSHIHEELGLKYKPELLAMHGTQYMIGLFQDERYFKSIEQDLRNEIYPKNKIKITKQLRSVLKNKNTVSVHIRRGDYNQLNNTLKLTYYRNAIECINKNIKDAFFCIFSDDLEWTKQHLDFGKNACFINDDKKLADYEELLIMSQCKHNIIANSTFSWWGAWLNRNPQKIVIGPEHWLNNSNENIMPERWIKIK